MLREAELRVLIADAAARLCGHSIISMLVGRWGYVSWLIVVYVAVGEGRRFCCLLLFTLGALL